MSSSGSGNIIKVLMKLLDWLDDDGNDDGGGDGDDDGDDDAIITIIKKKLFDFLA